MIQLEPTVLIGSIGNGNHEIGTKIITDQVLRSWDVFVTNLIEHYTAIFLFLVFVLVGLWLQLRNLFHDLLVQRS